MENEPQADKARLASRGKIAVLVIGVIAVGAEMVGVDMSTVSRHLAILRSAGIIEDDTIVDRIGIGGKHVIFHVPYGLTKRSTLWRQK